MEAIRLIDLCNSLITGFVLFILTVNFNLLFLHMRRNPDQVSVRKNQEAGALLSNNEVKPS
jgi:hypothetical protein